MPGFRNYIYVSRNKTEQYLAQMPKEVRSKLVSEFKLKTPVHEQALKTEFEEEKRSSLYRDVDTVVYEVERQGFFGGLSRLQALVPRTTRCTSGVTWHKDLLCR